MDPKGTLIYRVYIMGGGGGGQRPPGSARPGLGRAHYGIWAHIGNIIYPIMYPL